MDPVYAQTGAPAHAAYAAAQLWRLAAEEPVSKEERKETMTGAGLRGRSGLLIY